MAIQISYQPSAAAVGGAAYVGGLGQYNQWLNNLLWNQFQFGTQTNLQEQQMAQQRMLAMQQAASQMAQQQQQQAFEMQQLPMRSYLDAQNQAYQSQLAMQRDQQQQMLQSQLGNAASQRDFMEQRQLSAQQAEQQSQLQAAREQAATAGNLNEMQFRSQLQQGQQDMALWQNPFSQHLQNLQRAQQSGGYTLTDEQSQQAENLKNDISAIQQQAASGGATVGDLMPSFKQKLAQLNSIVPSKPPPMSIQDLVKQNIAWVDPQTGEIASEAGPNRVPMIQDPKTGKLQVVRDWPKPGEYTTDENGNVILEKTRQSQMKSRAQEEQINVKRLENIDRALQREEPSLFQQSQIMDPAGRVIGIDMNRYNQLRAQKRAELEARYGAAAQQATTQVTPQPPDVGQQPPPQAPQQQQQMEAQQVFQSLMSRPTSQWSRQDWEAAKKVRLILSGA